jgi:hypothetical protein
MEKYLQVVAGEENPGVVEGGEWMKFPEEKSQSIELLLASKEIR